MAAASENSRDDEPKARPRKTKKKKRKRSAPEGEKQAEKAALRPELDAKGNERPRFLLSFPEDPALEPLIEAFEAGNYAFVRDHAGQVAEETQSEAVRLAALELRRRIEPDPLLKFLLLASMLLLLLLAGWAYMTHGAHVLGPDGDHAGHNH